jgi:hypothetical protein
MNLPQTNITRFALPSAEEQKNWYGHVQQRLEPCPVPWRDPIMHLAEIIGEEGVAAMTKKKYVSFHATGDVGKGPHTPQEDVANAMALAYGLSRPETCPAFLFLLGDLIYGVNKTNLYADQFYLPYAHYPGKIIAIPGNHDSETMDITDTTTCEAFLKNFCDPTPSVPEIAGTIYRNTMNLPGTYFMLRMPFVDVIALNSGSGEDVGCIGSDKVGWHQVEWLKSVIELIRTEREAGNKKWLMIAVHHPPFCGAGHSGSSAMLKAIDDLFLPLDLYPDMWISGHSHSYQRYERDVALNGKISKIPFVVCGVGGYGLQHAKDRRGEMTDDRVLKANYSEYGYLTLKASLTKLTCAFFTVDGRKSKEADKVEVTLPKPKKA